MIKTKISLSLLRIKPTTKILNHCAKNQTHHTRRPLLKIKHKTKKFSITSTIRKYFVDAGAPVRISADGDPQFASNKFRQFLRRRDISHALSTQHINIIHN